MANHTPFPTSSGTRLGSALAVQHIESFGGALRGAGFRPSTIMSFLRIVERLGTWMCAEGLTLEDLDDTVVHAFEKHLVIGLCRYHSTAIAARHFLAHLRDRGVLSAPPPPRLPTLIGEFEDWMSSHRGVTPSTLKVYRPLLQEFLATLGDAPERYDVSPVREFLRQRTAPHGLRRARTVFTSVRMFLRYLASRGRSPARLIDAVPRTTEWRLSSLPTYLRTEEVDRLLRACDASTLGGRRDRAILLLLVRLGLRAGEVASIKANDIDWSAARIRVAGKGRRSTLLPLPQDVGNAILKYVAAGRPVSPGGHVFLRLVAPLRSMTRHTVSCVVNATAARAGVELARGGAHILRHTAATMLLRQGLPLSAIGALLRHRSIDTTAHYAKVDTATLSQVAQPWPGEVGSC